MSDLIWYFPFSVWLASLSMTIFFKSKHFRANGIISFFLWLSNIGGTAGKESACNMGDLGSIPRLGRCPGEGKGYPVQCSGLDNSMDRGAWQATVHGGAKSQTWLSDFPFQHSIVCVCVCVCTTWILNREFLWKGTKMEPVLKEKFHFWLHVNAICYCF